MRLRVWAATMNSCDSADQHRFRNCIYGIMINFVESPNSLQPITMPPAHSIEIPPASSTVLSVTQEQGQYFIVQENNNKDINEI